MGEGGASSPFLFAGRLFLLSPQCHFTGACDFTGARVAKNNLIILLTFY